MARDCRTRLQRAKTERILRISGEFLQVFSEVIVSAYMRRKYTRSEKEPNERIRDDSVQWSPRDCSNACSHQHCRKLLNHKTFGTIL